MRSRRVFNPSKPFVITALITLIIGSVPGTLWMMTIFGLTLPAELISTTNLHRLLQFDGFITLIIMGVGYLIVPRFRNISLPSVTLAYASYILILVSIIFSILISSGAPEWIHSFGYLVAHISRILGVGIFCTMILTILRVRPKLLRMADYFIGLSVILFAMLTISHSLNYNEITQNVQLWLMFPIMMIFGIEYKTLPSFIGFIWPRKTPAIISATLLTLSLGCSLVNSFFPANTRIEALFHSLFLTGVVAFTWALNIFVGFDTSKIMQLSMGEKKARYKYTLIIARISFAFLLTGITLSIFSVFFSGVFALYDLWIHIIAIGFIGLTIALYLPLMLSPILGRAIRFSHFSRLPIGLS